MRDVSLRVTLYYFDELKPAAQIMAIQYTNEKGVVIDEETEFFHCGKLYIPEIGY
jgi:hypothetical protein